MNTPISNEIRNKIRQYSKNQIDISPLIQNINIRGEDLSRTIIKSFNRPDDDISGCNFYQTIIGEEGKITNLNRITAKNCNFHRAKFLGTVWVRNADFRDCNFREADLVAFDYKFANFQGCDCCDVIIRIGSDKGTGAKFDSNFLKDLAGSWGVEVKLK